MPREFIAVIIVTVIFGIFLLLMFISDLKTLNIKSKQWVRVSMEPPALPQSIVFGCNSALKKVTAIVDSGDVHASTYANSIHYAILCQYIC